MFKKLMPKEEKYFEDFKELVSHIQEMAKITHAFFSSPSYDKDIYLKLKPIEKRCDEISDKITKRLNKSFITPFDREDIFSLTKKLDSIGNNLMRAAVRVDIFSLDKKIEYAEDLSAIVLQQIKELGVAIEHLKDRGDHMNEVKAVRDLETEADNVHRTALKQLFLNEKDPITLIKKKEILETLENASDKCQTTANVIMSIFIKNS